MDGGQVAASVFFIVSVALYALTSVGEAALVQAAEASLRERQGNNNKTLNAQMLRHLLDSLPRSLSVLVGTKLVLAVVALVCVVALYGPTDAAWEAEAGALSFTALVLALLPALLPAVLRPGPHVALRAAPWLFLLSLLAIPFVRLFEAVVPRRDRTAAPSLSAAAPSLEASAASEETPLHQEHERRMIQSILELDVTTAREIMTPRVDLMAVPGDTPVAELVQLMVETGHTRIPVYEDTVDHIIGVVHARDFLRMSQSGQPALQLRSLLRPALFIPESKRLNDLLREFQEQRVHVAIVVDEYGGTAGIVTLDDLLAEIVGELSEGVAREEPEVQVLSPNEALVHARTSLESINKLFGSTLQGDGVDTIGGYLFGLLGKMPAVGDRLPANGLSLEVAELVGRRIRKVRVRRTQGASTEEEEPERDTAARL
ncbi:MAG: HlyC/CorC family transporter [Dehalococcoidia bacterium]|nr:HlyC/CorC family transporter [Dehalococcoidia bacterium]